MNWDIKKIVVIEADENRVAFHKDNVIVLPEFTGDWNDWELIDLLPFLEHLA